MKHALTMGILGALLSTLVMTACTSKYNKTPEGPSGAGTATATGTDTPLPSLTPTDTWTPIPTATDTPTQAPTASMTPTYSPTIPPTATRTPTPFYSPTASPTGCLKTCFYDQTTPTVAAAGTTVTGFIFIGVWGCGSGSCSASEPLHYISTMSFSTAITGNLAAEILGVQLWANGVLVASAPYTATSFNLSLSPAPERRGPFDLRFVLSPFASGTIQTTLAYATNGVIPGWYMGPGLSQSPILTVGSPTTNTPSVTPTATFTATFTPTTTPTATFTPTP